MLGRLIVGGVLGLVVGGLVAAVLVAGLHMVTFAGAAGPVFAFLAAAATGALTGLVAGKPVWSRGAQVEAGLKALFGALFGVGVMFALRRWGGSWTLALPQIGVDQPTSIADLPATSLPLLAAALGSLLGLDNTDSGKGGPTSSLVGAGAGKVASRAGGAAVKGASGRANSATEEDPDDDVEAGSKRANR